MGVFDRLRRSPAAADLPKLAFPPLHDPATTLDAFDAATRLDPIPLGIGEHGGDPVYWSPSQHGEGLLVLGGTGTGSTQLTSAVVEQCRTRGWQVIAADGRFDLLGQEESANISFLGRPSGGFGDPAASQCLAAVVIAHRLFTERREAARRGDAVPATPLLLALTEFAGLVQTWRGLLPDEDIDNVCALIGELIHQGGGVRCHVLLMPASGHRWQVPAAWAQACAQVYLGDVDEHLASVSDDPAGVRAASRRIKAGRIKGRGVLVENRGTDITGFQAFYTYAPGQGGTEPVDAHAAWNEFRESVSDKAADLYPPLKLDPFAAGFPAIAACTWPELRRLPIVTRADG